MKKWFLYSVFAGLFFIASCSPNYYKFPQSNELAQNSRSSLIDSLSSKDSLPRFFDYRVFEEITLDRSQTDNYKPKGIYDPPRYWITINLEKEMVFGNDSVKCRSKFRSDLYYFFSRTNILAEVFNVLEEERDKRNKLPHKNEDHSSTTFEYATMSGTIQHPDHKEPVAFNFSRDSGTLMIYADTFLLRPVFASDREKTGVIIGVQLNKGTVPCAAIQKFPRKIFFSNKTTQEEEFFIAAYFAVICRYL
jgi:hypothetical protein